jgi:hypothetical protein
MRAWFYLNEGLPMQPELRARIMVATPSYNGVTAFECAISMQVATVLCLARGVLLHWIYVNGFSLVQCARDWLTAEFLSRPEFTHLLWLDDDVGFDPDGIMKLIESDLDMVGGVYPVKNDAGIRFAYEPSGHVVGNLQPVSRLPGGFLLVERQAVEAVAGRCEYYELANPCGGESRKTPHVFDVMLIDDPANPGTKIVLGEDYLFCRRLAEAGFPLYARTDIAFSHVGRYSWNGRLADYQRNAHAA